MGDYGGSILDPIMKGLSLRAFIDDLKYKKELRERDRQLYAMDLEDRKRQKAMEDFKTSLLLQQAGAIPVKPIVPGFGADWLEAGTRGRRLKTPTGEEVLMPTPDQRFQRDVEAARQAGTVKGVEERTREDITNPFVTVPIETGLPAPFGIGQKRMREKDVGRQATRPEPQHTIKENTDAEGNVTYDVFDRQGNLVRSIGRKGIGKPTGGEKGMSDSEQRARAAIRAKARVQREYTPEVFEKEVDAYEKGRYQTLAQAEGIDWQYEQEAMGAGTRTRPDGTTERVAPDPEKARHVAQVKAQARKWAEDVVNRKREALEQAYTEEEIGNGPTSTSTASPAARATRGRGRGRASMDAVKERARADVKAAGETPQAIAAFEKIFGKYR